MITVTLSQTGTGTSAEYDIPRGGQQASLGIGFGCVTSGTVEYTVQHTFDGTNWFDHESVAAASDDQDGNYAFPVKAIRLNVASGSGSVTMTALIGS